MNVERHYAAIRPFEGYSDEITLTGAGWKKVHDGAQYTGGADGRLNLKFRGNRVDLVLRPDQGGATVLIDGQAPSKLDLYHGLRPLQAQADMVPPTQIVQYLTGPDMQAETWEMTFKDISKDAKKFSFHLRGSLTGDDGDGTNTETFVSKSGRITIQASDYLEAWHYPPEDLAERPAPRLTCASSPTGKTTSNAGRFRKAGRRTRSTCSTSPSPTASSPASTS